MNYREQLQCALDYIEDNLCQDLDLDRIAASTGYSKYHFLRIFKAELGMTPGEYIRKRRITESAYEIADTEKAISQIGFEHGFNSKENFTRAFLGEHCIRPSEYRLTDNSLQLLSRESVTDSVVDLQPRIVELPSQQVTVLKSHEETPPGFWNRYNCGGFSGKLSGGRIVTDYGISVWDRELCKMDYYIGILTSEAHGDLTGTEQLELAGGLYAVFSTPKADKFDFVNRIHATWDFIHGKWLAESGYQRGIGYDFETYQESSREYSEQIFIPIRKPTEKGEADEKTEY